MSFNTPSSGTPIVPATPASALGPEQVPQWRLDRADVIQNTRGSLNHLAEATLPLAVGAGMIGIMAYGMKMMATGKPAPLLSKNA